ncbi:RMD1 family protein [Ferrovibrio xuzhouensis]|uniref:RMD1 family protein n=1 Tax=Ferrovibrio xuzhouensis TaxID=1576914 RepID=A0ABV7VBK5_9PROT
MTDPQTIAQSSAAASAAQSASPAAARLLTVRAILLGERIDTTGLERSDAISTVPFAFRVGDRGMVALFRYGAAVIAGLSPVEEDDILRMIQPRVSGSHTPLEDEVATIRIGDAGGEDAIPPGGPLQLRELTPERFLVIADVLGKSVALAHNEREVSKVFDIIDPLARNMAGDGRVPGNRKQLLKLIGESLLVQHRVAGRVAVEDKPDVLWDRPELERLFSRLQDEYELTERADALANKVTVIQNTTRALTDLIDAQRSLRLEAAIVLLIVFEIALTLIDWIF